MDFSVSIKIYNKEDKLKLSINENKAIKSILFYKYNEDDNTKITYSFLCEKEKGSIKPWHAYYEMILEEGGKVMESVMISENDIEHSEIFGDTEKIRITKKLKTGNTYEERTKNFKGETFKIEYINGELSEFKFPIQENKINEYLKILSYE